MNVGAIQDRIEDLGFPPPSITLVDSMHKHICGMRRWSWMEATDTVACTVNDALVNTSTLDPPMQKPDRVSIELGADYEMLDFLRPRDFRELEHEDRDIDMPTYWTYWGRTIRVWPRPNAPYTARIDYLRTPTELDGDGDEPNIPAPYQDVLVWAGVVQMALRQRDFGLYDRSTEMVQSRLDGLIREEGITNRSAGSGSRVVPYDYGPGLNNLW